MPLITIIITASGTYHFSLSYTVLTIMTRILYYIYTVCCIIRIIDKSYCMCYLIMDIELVDVGTVFFIALGFYNNNIHSSSLDFILLSYLVCSFPRRSVHLVC